MSILKDLKTLEVSLVPKAANQKKFMIFKSEEGGFEMEKEVIKEEKIEEVVKEEKIEEVEQKMKIEKENLNDFNLPNDVKEQLQALWKQNEEMIKKNQLLEMAIQKAEDEKLLNKYVEVAKSYKNIPVEPNEFGMVLKEIAQKAPNTIEKMQEILKATDKALKDSSIIFKELGSTSSYASNAWDKIEQFANSLSEDGKISKAEAITKAIEINPKLYDEYLKEKEGGR